MKRLPILALLLTASALTACSPKPTEDHSSVSGNIESSANADGFSLALTFSPAAKAKVSGMGEKVNVAAMYWGEPSESGKAKADEIGQINLNRDDVIVEAIDQTVTVPGTGLDRSALTDITGEPMLLINVYTARQKHEDNLLDCGIFEGAISQARATAPAIHCKLIEE